MARITISKALKFKNRLAARISQTSSDIQDYNSVIKDTDRDVDINAAMKDRARLVEALIKTKAAIFEANRKVYEDIVRISELKAEIVFLRTISTSHGPQSSYGSQDPIIHEAHLRKADVDKRVRELESDIDSIQDKLDAFNAETKIEIAVTEL